MISQELKKQLIPKLLERRKKSIINFGHTEPRRFKVGFFSPIYCNFREIQTYPELEDLVTQGFIEITGLQKGDPAAVIGGVQTGGYIHARPVGVRLHIPTAYVRPGAQEKGYGLQNLIEGDVEGKIVYLIEDLVTTATSMIEDAKIYLAAGAKEVRLFSLFSYDFDFGKKNLQTAGFTFESILTIHDLMPFLKEQLLSEQYDSLCDFIGNPVTWFSKYKLNFEFGYNTILRQSAKKVGNIGCFGIDPVIGALPENFEKEGIYGAGVYIGEIFELLSKHGLSPAAFKFNHGFFRRYMNPFKNNYDGLDAMARIMGYGKQIFEGIPQISDFKTGDIKDSSENYAIEGFEIWRSDAVTIAPYMGKDSIDPYAAYCNKIHKRGGYILTLTSNKGAADIQNLVLQNGKKVRGVVAEKVIEWAKGHPGLGSVVGATDFDSCHEVLQILTGKDIPALLPGVGKQGQNGSAVMEAIRASGFEQELARINNSSGLTHPWAKEKVVAAPTNWRDVIRKTFEEFSENTRLAA